MNFKETLDSDKGVTKLIWFEDDLFNEAFIEYNKSNSICFNSYARDDIKLLSNHSVCRIRYNGMLFNSVEQIYNYMRYYQHKNVQIDIMRIDSPSEIKLKCNRYYNNLYPDVKQQTHNFRTNLLLFSQRLKLQQNPAVINVIEKRLIKYNSLVIVPQLVEYTWWNDTKNGTIDIDSTFIGDFKRGNVKGQNRSGRMLRRCYMEFQNGLLDQEIKPPYDYII